MEITLRSYAGIDAICNVAQAGLGMLVGTETVLSVEQAKQAKVAGADFSVSPGFN